MFILELIKSRKFILPVLGYFTTSLTLFMYPQLIHKKKVYNQNRLNQAINNKKDVLIVAHRGGSRIGLQNTLETFHRCFEISKVDMIEMDVGFSKDKQLVVHHDVSLKRTCGIDKTIDEFNYQDLPPFSEKVRLHFSDSLTQNSQGRKMPLLQTIFQEFPHALINVQIKTPTQQAILQFDRLVRKYKMQDKVICGIRGDLNAQLKRNNSKTMTFFNQKQIFRLFYLFITGLLPFSKIQNNSLQIPVWTEQYKQWLLSQSQNKMKVRALFVGIKLFDYIFTPIISHLRRRGILTIGWVCNDDSQYERALNMGVSGIMSDRPDHLQKYLLKKYK